MQALCQCDLDREAVWDALAALATDLAALTEGHSSDLVVQYAERICRDYLERSAVIDEQIASALVNWRLDRLASVERNVMRVAVVEWQLKEVPPRVVLDEALEIAREYGTNESVKFVNGVLDAVWKKMQAGE